MSRCQIDLLLWPGYHRTPQWSFGDTGYLPGGSVSAAFDVLSEWVERSQADYVLLWSSSRKFPAPETVFGLVDNGIDLAHCGLKQGLGECWSDLDMVIQNWSLLNAPETLPSSSWRVGLDACLSRRALLREIGGLDRAFVTATGAGLDLGFRCLSRGALVEYRPELLADIGYIAAEPSLTDLYTFVLRHWSPAWARYLALRRSVVRRNGVAEYWALRHAQVACERIPAPIAAPSTWYGEPPPDAAALQRAEVSVIIPTLGRYPYLPGALDSLRRQTIMPREVIVVDQNPIEARQPDVYEPYHDLNLRLIWQDQRGQSLARNTGLAVARGQYVLLFDDDSIAAEDLIEAHVREVMGGRFHASTGVAYPPGDNYLLPPSFRHRRLAQTFDTGNSLLPLALARQLGGLDRNYDFGPGTDLDFGTRLYLAGQRILHNPLAVRTHFKAPVGGLRVFAAHKYNTDIGLLQPFPPVTQSYYGLRYLSRGQRRERALLQFVTSKFPPELRHASVGWQRKIHALLSICLSCVFLPVKWYRSHRRAAALLQAGPRLGSFERRADAEPGCEPSRNGGNGAADQRVACD